MSRSAAPFSARGALTLAALALFCLGAMAVLAAFAPDLERGDDGRAHALSRSAIGYAALVELLDATGQRPVLLRGPAGGEADGLLVLTPEPGGDREAARGLLERERSVLIVLPKWRVAPLPTRPGWVQRANALPVPMVISVLPDGLPPLMLDEDTGSARLQVSAGAGRNLGRSGVIEGARTISGDGWLPVIVDGQGRGLVVTHVETGAYVLSDPDLLATHALDDREAAETALALLSVISSGQPVRFDLTLAGFSRPRGLLRLMLEPPLLGFTLALVVAGLLTALQAAVRFGPPRVRGRAIALGKRTLADNTAALARLARREHALAPAYVEVIRRSALRQAAAPPDLSSARADSLLDRMASAGGSDTKVSDLAARATTLGRRDDVAAFARALFTWKRTLTRASR